MGGLGFRVSGFRVPSGFRRVEYPFGAHRDSIIFQADKHPQPSLDQTQKEHLWQLGGEGCERERERERERLIQGLGFRV